MPILPQKDEGGKDIPVKDTGTVVLCQCCAFRNDLLSISWTGLSRPIFFLRHCRIITLQKAVVAVTKRVEKKLVMKIIWIF